MPQDLVYTVQLKTSANLAICQSYISTNLLISFSINTQSADVFSTKHVLGTNQPKVLPFKLFTVQY